MGYILHKQPKLSSYQKGKESGLCTAQGNKLLFVLQKETMRSTYYTRKQCALRITQGKNALYV